MRTDADTTSIYSSVLSLTPTESTPLLQGKLLTGGTWRSEFRWLFTNSIPIIGTYLLQNSLQLASIFTLGHLGPTELAASAIGGMFASVSCWSVAFGTATALDTLCSQSWTGASDKTLVGIHLQRALAILGLIFTFFVVPIWWNGTRIMLALNQEPEVALLAGTFLRYLLLGAPAFIAFEALKKYLQAQGIMHASTFVLMIASPLNFCVNYMLVHVEPVRLGFIGAPLATAFSYWVMLILLLLYTWKVRGKEAWGGWSREALQNWWPFLRLAIPGTAMVCSEWWAYQLTALAASYLGTISLASQSILLTSAAATFQIPFGISIATANRIGNALGESFALKAKRASMVALVFAVIFGLINSLFFIVTRTSFGYLFTSDEDVIECVAHILPFCALFQLADSVNGVCGGIIRGLGHQKVAAWINLFAYYILALPMAYSLTFHAGWALAGLWVGLSIAMYLAGITQVIYIFAVNWDAEVERISFSVKSEEAHIYDATTPLLAPSA
ncbi:mate-domain-containing protein [Fennellomyces sp. T-0311]|nr:mate-domain-containing protein [Fennellomyces sp. T-0311]